MPEAPGSRGHSRGRYPTPQADPRSDADLLVLARGGDECAFGVLLRRHGRTAFVVARSVVGDPDLAEDVCQDALFRVWRRLGDCREPARFGAWLARAIHRHAQNAIRGRRKSSELEEELPFDGPSPERLAETADRMTRLERALATLPRAEREAILLHDLEGWSHAEIGELLGTSEAMSRQHLMAGRRRVRRLMGDGEE